MCHWEFFVNWLNLIFLFRTSIHTVIFTLYKVNLPEILDKKNPFTLEENMNCFDRGTNMLSVFKKMFRERMQKVCCKLKK